MTVYIEIKVPEEHHGAVLRHLGSLMTEARPETPMPEEAQDVASAPIDGVWSEDVWEKAWPGVTANTRKLMVELATRQGEWVTIEDLENLLGDFATVQATLSSLTKRLKRFGQTEWPFEVGRDDEGHMTYRMDEATASIVLAQNA